jgi:DNA polymerase V
MNGKTAIGHLDADCFYVSAERVRDPFLLNKPVGVLGNHGACVIARSYEMRARGVRTGEPIWDAVKACPEGIYVKRDFRWYEVLSRKMLDVVCSLSPAVEYYSIDEFFFAVPPRPVGPDPLRLATEMRDRIFKEVGVPVTACVARTRTLSKLFVEQVKPFGACAVLDTEEERRRLAALPVTEVAGIAARRAARLAPYNVRTCLDFARMQGWLVRSLLTSAGEALWRELNGVPCMPLQTDRPPHQALSRGGSIGAASSDRNVIYGWAVRNLERLIEELEFHRVRAGRLTVWLDHADGPAGLGECRLDTPTDRFDTLLDATRAGLRQAWREGERVTRIQLIATHLRGPGSIQRSLFESPGWQSEAVARLKREVNAKFGRFALRSGATLYLPRAVYADPSNAYDICDVRGKLCF